MPDALPMTDSPCLFYEEYPLILGLTGKLHSGKDTVYQYIKDLRSDLNVRRDAFADRLKLSAGRSIGIYGTDEEVLRDVNEFKERGVLALAMSDAGLIGVITGRQYLQFAGTEGGRNIFGESFWTEQVLDGTAGPPYWGQDPFDVLIITDVRFDDEAKTIVDRGGQIWEIRRPGKDGDTHASEAGIDPTYVEVIIDNDGTLDDLKVKVAELVCR